MSHWLKEALQEGLRAVDNADLIRGACEHCSQEDPYREDRAKRRISPTLIAEECRLSRLKRYRKHSPQPGWEWRSVKAGRPSASSNLHTLRGTFGEGMAVIALRAVEAAYSMTILGVSPTMAFEHSDWTDTQYEQGGYLAPVEINYLAYPDVVMLHEGVAELIQMKCPSVHAFARYRRDGPASVNKRYGPQAIAEMYVGRKSGLPIVRNHILLFAFEGELPSSDQAKAGQEILSEVVTVEWQDGMDRFVESIAEEIIEDDLAADRGEWPVAYPQGTKWPCDYCTWPRTAYADGVAACEEVEKWGEQRSRSSESPTTGISPGPLGSTPRATSPPPLPAPTSREVSSVRLSPARAIPPPLPR